MMFFQGMMLKVLVLTCLVLILGGHVASGRESPAAGLGLELLKLHPADPGPETAPHAPARAGRPVAGSLPDFLGFRDDLSFASRLAIRMYQLFISPQDQPSCMFHPSCSSFTMQAIQQHGIRGLLISADRLTRCNGVGFSYYEVGPGAERISDPPEIYLLRP